MVAGLGPPPIVCQTLVSNHYFPKPTNRQFSTCGPQISGIHYLEKW